MKYINIEFFDEETIENVITCLNFKMDKTIFFGYARTMTKEKKRITENYLKTKCFVNEVEFHEVNEYDLEDIMKKITLATGKEQENGNRCYFDLTGGEDLVLVAIGMLAERYKIPMHKYDVKKDLLIGFSDEKDMKINKTAPKQEIVLTLDDIIGMQGGIINYRKQKNYKDNLDNENFKSDILNMWEVAGKNAAKWNAFSAILKECNKYETKEKVTIVPRKKWESVLRGKTGILSAGEVEKYFHDLQKKKVIIWQTEKENVRFSYKSEEVKESILDAGCLLELSTYYNRKGSGRYSDVRVGVHLDWDGEINRFGKDVENEIDVMLLEGNVPTFISCKNGEVSPMALYEIDAIAKEMGGKYARKELVIGADMASVQRERAMRMDIVVTGKNYAD